jgi:adenosylcobinamide-GDP ribazoletransferase
MACAPVAIAPLAAAAALVFWVAAAAQAPPLVTATITVATLALGSGGLHLDGLADTFDGLSAPGPRSRALEIMRRGDVGPSGAAALVFVLLLQIGSLDRLAAEGGEARTAVTVAVAVLASRVVLPVGCIRGLRPARTDGLGADVASTVPPPLCAVVVGTMATAAALWDGYRGMVGVLLVVGAAGLTLVVCRRKLGGLTGDVLGACVEVALATYLVVQATSPSGMWSE